MLIIKHLDGQGQPAVKLLIQLLHNHQRHLFVVDTAGQSVFQHMRERTMPNVVHQDGSFYGCGFSLADFYPLGL